MPKIPVIDHPAGCPWGLPNTAEERDSLRWLFAVLENMNVNNGPNAGKARNVSRFIERAIRHGHRLHNELHQITEWSPEQDQHDPSCREASN